MDGAVRPGRRRLYHVITDWSAFWPHHLRDVPAIWQGGLGIWGAVLGGMLGCWIACRRLKVGFWTVADCIAPGLILAQALGRWGNYANQELYGHPSSLPWALKIPPIHRFPHYQAHATYQPLFLYESLWDAGACLVLLWFTRRYWRRVPPSAIFALYVVLYCTIRLPLETLRIDPADHLFGQRINVWVAGAEDVIGLVWFVIAAGAARPSRRPSSRATIPSRRTCPRRARRRPSPPGRMAAERVEATPRGAAPMRPPP